MITLQSGAYVVQLKTEGFPQRTLLLKTVHRRTQAGTMITIVRTPEEYRITVNVNLMDLVTRQALAEFVRQVQGDRIRYIDDQEPAVQWDMCLLDVPVAITNVDRSLETVTLNLEGNKV